MTMRTRRETVHFRHAFCIKGIDRQLEMISINSVDLSEAQRIDTTAPHE